MSAVRGPGRAVILAAATLALRLRDPHVPGEWGFCPIYATTGCDGPVVARAPARTRPGRGVSRRLTAA